MMPSPGRGYGPRSLPLLLSALLYILPAARAEDLEDADALLRAGKYEECARLATQEVRRGAWGDEWRVVKVEAQMALGLYEEALATVDDALQRFPGSIPLLWAARDVYRYNNRDADAESTLTSIEALVSTAPRRMATPGGRVVLGRYFLARGADAKKVLEQFYDVAMKERPDLAEAYYAAAELALEKHDDALAAETLGKAPKTVEADPRYQVLLARAFTRGDRPRAQRALTRALELNPRSVEALLLVADHRIDAERYDEAARTLDRAAAVNPREPRVWAYRAVLAHIRNDRQAEEAARREAHAHWARNPEVDHLIGRELSRKYRFDEGAACQRRSLALDPAYLPARIQLAEDLLKLGQETEGWALADEVLERDGYNVVAFNLVALRDKLAGFRTLEGDGLVVRMDPLEADLYGPRVLDLLKRARTTLGAKYGVTPPESVIVEIFPQKKDFAVRTFGLPGADGLLGVCFGRVVTASSPASRGEHPSSWESVLWHEFCHVVTLTKTRNTMPRWLSEGISVHEEGREDPAWATPFSPQFRAMVLDEKSLTPLSRLSSAFLAPETPLRLQFAYFEAALAVDFLVERFGAEALNGLLDDLRAGATTEVALPKRTKMTLDELDGAFASFARQRAAAIAPRATWEEPDLPASAGTADLKAWLAGHPNSFHGLRRLGARLMDERNWDEARKTLLELEALFPEYTGPENPYVLLATVHRNQGDPTAERAALEKLVARDGSASSAFLRLLELDEAAGAWEKVAENARRLLGVNPLVPAPHRQLARAAERLGRTDEAIAGYRALARLDPSDPAETHFRLASLLARRGERDEARRQVLMALEEAPRFLEAHALLLELVEGDQP